MAHRKSDPSAVNRHLNYQISVLRRCIKELQHCDDLEMKQVFVSAASAAMRSIYDRKTRGGKYPTGDSALDDAFAKQNEEERENPNLLTLINNWVAHLGSQKQTFIRVRSHVRKIGGKILQRWGQSSERENGT